jgi:hypothetical protein
MISKSLISLKTEFSWMCSKDSEEASSVSGKARVMPLNRINHSGRGAVRIELREEGTGSVNKFAVIFVTLLEFSIFLSLPLVVVSQL